MAACQDSSRRARQNSRRRRRAVERARQRAEQATRRAELDALMATVPVQYLVTFVPGQDVEWRQHGVVYRGMFGHFLGGTRATVRITVRVRSDDGREETREEERTVSLAKLRRLGYYGPVYWKVRSSNTGGRFETKPHRLVTGRERLLRQVASAQERLSEEERRTLQRGNRRLRGSSDARPKRTHNPRSTPETGAAGSAHMSIEEQRRQLRELTGVTHDWLVNA